MSEKKVLTFRVDEDRADKFHRALLQLQGAGEVDPDATRSDVLRSFVDEFADNPNPDLVSG
jgi:hypothetical protein